ncbi:unnamed protein product [Amoebophrya sp. A120]|nr:unnamed protein product [Amoebophrya sp. A120]|eukprot:GSA120T00004134001.1
MDRFLSLLAQMKWWRGRSAAHLNNHFAVLPAIILVLLLNFATSFVLTEALSQKKFSPQKHVVKVRAIFQSQSYLKPWEKPPYSTQSEVFHQSVAFAAGLCINQIRLPDCVDSFGEDNCVKPVHRILVPYYVAVDAVAIAVYADEFDELFAVPEIIDKDLRYALLKLVARRPEETEKVKSFWQHLDAATPGGGLDVSFNVDVGDGIQVYGFAEQGARVWETRVSGGVVLPAESDPGALDSDRSDTVRVLRFGVSPTLDDSYLGGPAFCRASASSAADNNAGSAGGASSAVQLDEGSSGAESSFLETMAKVEEVDDEKNPPEQLDGDGAGVLESVQAIPRKRNRHHLLPWRPHRRGLLAAKNRHGLYIDGKKSWKRYAKYYSASAAGGEQNPQDSKGTSVAGVAGSSDTEVDDGDAPDVDEEALQAQALKQYSLLQKLQPPSGVIVVKTAPQAQDDSNQNGLKWCGFMSPRGRVLTPLHNRLIGFIWTRKRVGLPMLRFLWEPTEDPSFREYLGLKDMFADEGDESGGDGESFLQQEKQIMFEKASLTAGKEKKSFPSDSFSGADDNNFFQGDASADESSSAVEIENLNAPFGQKQEDENTASAYVKLPPSSHFHRKFTQKLQEDVFSDGALEQFRQKLDAGEERSLPSGGSEKLAAFVENVQNVLNEVAEISGELERHYGNGWALQDGEGQISEEDNDFDEGSTLQSAKKAKSTVPAGMNMREFDVFDKALERDFSGAGVSNGAGRTKIKVNLNEQSSDALVNMNAADLKLHPVSKLLQMSDLDGQESLEGDDSTSRLHLKRKMKLLSDLMPGMEPENPLMGFLFKLWLLHQLASGARHSAMVGPDIGEASGVAGDAQQAAPAVIIVKHRRPSKKAKCKRKLKELTRGGILIRSMDQNSPFAGNGSSLRENCILFALDGNPILSDGSMLYKRTLTRPTCKWRKNRNAFFGGEENDEGDNSPPIPTGRGASKHKVVKAKLQKTRASPRKENHAPKASGDAQHDTTSAPPSAFLEVHKALFPIPVPPLSAGEDSGDSDTDGSSSPLYDILSKANQNEEATVHRTPDGALVFGPVPKTRFLACRTQFGLPLCTQVLVRHCLGDGAADSGGPAGRLNPLSAILFGKMPQRPQHLLLQTPQAPLTLRDLLFCDGTPPTEEPAPIRVPFDVYAAMLAPNQHTHITYKCFGSATVETGEHAPILVMPHANNNPLVPEVRQQEHHPRLVLVIRRPLIQPPGGQEGTSTVPAVAAPAVPQQAQPQKEKRKRETEKPSPGAEKKDGSGNSNFFFPFNIFNSFLQEKQEDQHHARPAESVPRTSKIVAFAQATKVLLEQSQVSLDDQSERQNYHEHQQLAEKGSNGKKDAEAAPEVEVPPASALEEKAGVLIPVAAPAVGVIPQPVLLPVPVGLPHSGGVVKISAACEDEGDAGSDDSGEQESADEEQNNPNINSRGNKKKRKKDLIGRPRPKYVMLGGIVFSTWTTEMFQEYSNLEHGSPIRLPYHVKRHAENSAEWRSAARGNAAGELDAEGNCRPAKEYVITLGGFDCACNRNVSPYMKIIDIVTHVDGQEPQNFLHFLQLVQQAVSQKEFLTFKFLPSGLDEREAKFGNDKGSSHVFQDMALQSKCVRDFSVTKTIMHTHRIPAPVSSGRESDLYLQIVQGTTGEEQQDSRRNVRGGDQKKEKKSAEDQGEQVPGGRQSGDAQKGTGKEQRSDHGAEQSNTSKESTPETRKDAATSPPAPEQRPDVAAPPDKSTSGPASDTPGSNSEKPATSGHVSEATQDQEAPGQPSAGQLEQNQPPPTSFLQERSDSADPGPLRPRVGVGIPGQLDDPQFGAFYRALERQPKSRNGVDLSRPFFVFEDVTGDRILINRFQVWLQGNSPQIEQALNFQHFCEPPAGTSQGTGNTEPSTISNRRISESKDFCIADRVQPIFFHAEYPIAYEPNLGVWFRVKPEDAKRVQSFLDQIGWEREFGPQQRRLVNRIWMTNAEFTTALNAAVPSTELPGYDANSALEAASSAIASPTQKGQENEEQEDQPLLSSFSGSAAQLSDRRLVDANDGAATSVPRASVAPERTKVLEAGDWDRAAPELQTQYVICHPDSRKRRRNHDHRFVFENKSPQCMEKFQAAKLEQNFPGYEREPLPEVLGDDLGSSGLVKQLTDRVKKLEKIAEASSNVPLETVVELEIKFAEKGMSFFLNPWAASTHEQTKLCAGVVIRKPIRRILTCAHCAADATLILVRQGLQDDIRAFTTDIAHDLDLALLDVKDESFWSNVPIALTNDQDIESPKLPLPDSDVYLVGYPLGETSVSVTRGVISRVDERDPFSDELLSIGKSMGSRVINLWVDAAMNSGNSGGPAFDKKGRLLGVAFAGMPQQQGVGFLVPNVLVRQFILASSNPTKAELAAGGDVVQQMGDDRIGPQMVGGGRPPRLSEGTTATGSTSFEVEVCPVGGGPRAGKEQEQTVAPLVVIGTVAGGPANLVDGAAPALPPPPATLGSAQAFGSSFLEMLQHRKLQIADVKNALKELKDRQREMREKQALKHQDKIQAEKSKDEPLHWSAALKNFLPTWLSGHEHGRYHENGQVKRPHKDDRRILSEVLARLMHAKRSSSRSGDWHSGHALRVVRSVDDGLSTHLQGDDKKVDDVDGAGATLSFLQLREDDHSAHVYGALEEALEKMLHQISAVKSERMLKRRTEDPPLKHLLSKLLEIQKEQHAGKVSFVQSSGQPALGAGAPTPNAEQISPQGETQPDATAGPPVAGSRGSAPGQTAGPGTGEGVGGASDQPEQQQVEPPPEKSSPSAGLPGPESPTKEAPPAAPEQGAGSLPPSASPNQQTSPLSPGGEPAAESQQPGEQQIAEPPAQPSAEQAPQGQPPGRAPPRDAQTQPSTQQQGPPPGQPSSPPPQQAQQNPAVPERPENSDPATVQAQTDQVSQERSSGQPQSNSADADEQPTNPPVPGAPPDAKAPPVPQETTPDSVKPVSPQPELPVGPPEERAMPRGPPTPQQGANPVAPLEDQALPQAPPAPPELQQGKAEAPSARVDHQQPQSQQARPQPSPEEQAQVVPRGLPISMSNPEDPRRLLLLLCGSTFGKTPEQVRQCDEFLKLTEKRKAHDSSPHDVDGCGGEMKNRCYDTADPGFAINVVAKGWLGSPDIGFTYRDLQHQGLRDFYGMLKMEQAGAPPSEGLGTDARAPANGGNGAAGDLESFLEKRSTFARREGGDGVDTEAGPSDQPDIGDRPPGAGEMGPRPTDGSSHGADDGRSQRKLPKPPARGQQPNDSDEDTAAITGVQVVTVSPQSPLSGQLQTGDILTHLIMNGFEHKINNEGLVLMTSKVFAQTKQLGKAIASSTAELGETSSGTEDGAAPPASGSAPEESSGGEASGGSGPAPLSKKDNRGINVNFEVLISSLPVDGDGTGPRAALRVFRPQARGTGGSFSLLPLLFTTKSGAGKDDCINPESTAGVAFGVIPAFVPRFSDEPCLRGMCHPGLSAARLAKNLAFNAGRYVILGGALFSVLNSQLLDLADSVVPMGTMWELNRWQRLAGEEPVTVLRSVEGADLRMCAELEDFRLRLIQQVRASSDPTSAAPGPAGKDMSAPGLRGKRKSQSSIFVKSLQDLVKKVGSALKQGGSGKKDVGGSDGVPEQNESQQGESDTSSSSAAQVAIVGNGDGGPLPILVQSGAATSPPTGPTTVVGPSAGLPGNILEVLQSMQNGGPQPDEDSFVEFFLSDRDDLLSDMPDRLPNFVISRDCFRAPVPMPVVSEDLCELFAESFPRDVVMAARSSTPCLARFVPEERAGPMQEMPGGLIPGAVLVRQR